MSLHEYRFAQELDAQDPPFYGLLMAMIRKADTDNSEKIREAWPGVWREFEARYHSPGGLLPAERLPPVPPEETP